MGVLIPIIAAWEWYLGDAAMIPVSVFKTGTFTPVFLT
jgi:hypothetical protein